MTDPKISRRQIIKGAVAVGALGALGLPSAAFAEGGNEGGRRIRWDLVELTPPDVRPGGDDTASAEDESTLTLTGRGTFRPGHSRPVTGGGSWTSNNPVVAGSGTYRVTELISWNPGRHACWAGSPTHQVLRWARRSSLRQLQPRRHPAVR